MSSIPLCFVITGRILELGAGAVERGAAGVAALLATRS